MDKTNLKMVDGPVLHTQSLGSGSKDALAVGQPMFVNEGLVVGARLCLFVIWQIRLLFWDLPITCVIIGAHSYESDTSLITSLSQTLNTCQWNCKSVNFLFLEWFSSVKF